MPTYFQPPSPPSEEHDTAFLFDGNRSTNTWARVQQSPDYSESSNILIRALQTALASVAAQATGVGGSALPILIATSEQLFEALSPKSKRARRCASLGFAENAGSASVPY